MYAPLSLFPPPVESLAGEIKEILSFVNVTHLAYMLYLEKKKVNKRDKIK